MVRADREESPNDGGRLAEDEAAFPWNSAIAAVSARSMSGPMKPEAKPSSRCRSAAWISTPRGLAAALVRSKISCRHHPPACAARCDFSPGTATRGVS